MGVGFKSFCVLQSDLQDASEGFVGVRFDGGKPQIYFPYGCFQNIETTFEDEPSEGKPSDEELRQAFTCLMKVLSDQNLISDAENSNYASSLEFESKLDFPFQEFFYVLDYYLNFGLYKETEKIYMQGVHGKVNWSRTIKHIRPQVFKSERGAEIVYLNLISSCNSQNENQLVTLIHEFCVALAQKLIGPLYGVDADVESSLDFDYELFSAVLNEKCSRTFNDRKLRLFHAMQMIVEYLQGNAIDGTLSEYCYGVSCFAPVWERMLDYIFGNLRENENKDNFNPHCGWDIPGESEIATEKRRNDQKFAMRPDTIMRRGDEIYIVDAKFYTRSNLPTSSSISKQIVYAEFVEQKGFAAGDKIFNVFLLPYCHTTIHSETVPYEMNILGTALADWVDNSKPYHKIIGIQLDVKSVMSNYRRNDIAQYKLAEFVKDELNKQNSGDAIQPAAM